MREITEYFREKVQAHGAKPAGVDLNSMSAQEVRFAQLVKLIDPRSSFSIIDYGCGYGALIEYLDNIPTTFEYYGFDITAAMIEEAIENYGTREDCHFSTLESSLTPADYVVESGIFNLKLDVSYDDWTNYVLRTLDIMNSLATKGIAFNMLTKYSDADRMQANLYYADPCFFFDYCKRNFSRNVALLHDYELYDFTILVRK